MIWERECHLSWKSSVSLSKRIQNPLLAVGYLDMQLSRKSAAKLIEQPGVGVEDSLFENQEIQSDVCTINGLDAQWFGSVRGACYHYIVVVVFRPM